MEAPISPYQQSPWVDDEEIQSWVETIKLSNFYAPDRSVRAVAAQILTRREYRGEQSPWTPMERSAYEYLEKINDPRLPKRETMAPPTPVAIDEDDDLEDGDDDDDDDSSSSSNSSSSTSESESGSESESVINLCGDEEDDADEKKDSDKKLGAWSALLRPMSSKDITDSKKNLKATRMTGMLQPPKKGKPDPPKPKPPKRNLETSQEVDNEQEDDDGGEKKKKARTYNFNVEWKKNRPWLKFVDGKMFCLYCQNAKAETIWAKTGCTRLRPGAVKDHEEGSLHRDVVSKLKDEALKRKQGAGLIPVALEPAAEDTTAPYFSLFTNAHLCAKKNISSATFPAMCQHDLLKGAPVIDRFKTDVKCAEFEVCISDVLKKDLAAKLLKSPVVSITIDESTDVAHLSQMMIYVKYIDVDAGWIVKTEYLETVECDGADSESIFATLKACLQRWGIYDKLMAFGSDGAAVMIGEKTGVATRLASERKGMISIHCIAHRAALAAADAFDTVSFCRTLDECLRAVSNFYSMSTQRRKELKNLCALNNDPETQVASSAKTRWLTTGLVNDSILEKYDSIMEQHFDNRDVTTTSEAIFRKLSDYRILAGFSHSGDILQRMNVVSKLFQNRHPDGHTVKATVEALTYGLEHDFMGGTMCGGPNMKVLATKIPNFNGDPTDFDYGVRGGFKISMSKAKRDQHEQFAKELAAAVRDRYLKKFPQNEEVAALDVFLRRNFPVDREALINYGNADIATLAELYAPLGCTEEEFLAEWALVKSMIRARPATEDWASLFSNIMVQTTYSLDDFKWTRLAMQQRAILAFNSVNNERGFSHMKNAKKENQSNMRNETLDARLRIQLLGPTSPNDAMKEAPLSELKGQAAVAKLKELEKKYSEELAGLLNRAITLWRSRNKVSASLSQKRSNAGALARGVKKVRKHAPSAATERVKSISEGTALDVVSGRVHTVAALQNKISAPVEAPSAENIPKPAYQPLEDSLHIAPEPNLKTVDVGTLKKHKIAFLHELGDGSGWMWSPVLETTNKVRRSKKKPYHVIAEVRCPEGKRDVDLQDGKVYKKDWVLLTQRTGGAKEKKKKKKTPLEDEPKGKKKKKKASK